MFFLINMLVIYIELAFNIKYVDPTSAFGFSSFSQTIIAIT